MPQAAASPKGVKNDHPDHPTEQAGAFRPQRAEGEAQGNRSPRRRHSGAGRAARSEEHTSELQSLMRTSYAVFCLKKKTNTKPNSIYYYYISMNAYYL